MATLFQTSDAPANFGSANTPINVGMAFFVSSAANLVGIRFYKSASDPLTSHTVSLWDVSTHANLAQQASSGETASGWQEVTLTTPVALTANKAYRVSLFTPAPSGNAFYCYNSGYFTAAKTNGIITAYQSGTVPAANEPNNTYDFNNTADYPASDSGVQANYWVDVDVTTQFTVGNTAPGASNGAFTGLTALQVTMPQGGILQSVGIFWYQNPGAVNFLLGVYADNAGTPGALLATSALSTTATGAPQTLAMTTNPTIAAGTKVWLAVQQQTGVIAYYDTTAGSLGYFQNNASWTGALPSTAPSGSTGVFNFSLQANFLPASTALHFAMAIADTSTVLALTFHGATGTPPANITKVQGPLNAVGGSSVHVITKAFTANVTAGNFLVAFCNCGAGGSSTGAVTDSLGQTWTPAAAWKSSGSVAGGIFYKANTLGGACTVTLTCAASDNYPDLTIWEYSAIALASLTDGAVSGSGSSAAPSSGNITTANAADLLVSGCTTAGVGVNSGTSGWTFALTGNGNGYETRIVSTAGTYAATYVTGDSSAWVAPIAAFKQVAAGPVTLHFPMAIADTSTVLALTFHGATGIVFGHNYATAFPLTESPISEGGKWQGGLAVGLDWNDIRSTPAFAYGNQDGITGSTYADSTAILIGAWGPNQTVQGTIRVKAATNVVNVFEEVALRLRSTMAAHSCTGYECLISVSTEPTDGNYVQIVRWNGAIGSFTELNGASFHAVDGDILKATIVGSVITVFKNGTQVLTATDSTYTSGNPGVGHFLQNSPEAAVSPSDYGWQNWSATDGTPMEFPLVVADTSTVLTLGFHQAVATLHFPLTVADTSTVLALAFHTGAHFPLAVDDTSTVLRLGFEAYVRFPLVLDDVSTILALSFHQNVPPLAPHFPVVIADTSEVSALGFEQSAPLRFPMHMADTSTVLALGFHLTRRFGLAIADTSTVLSLSFNQFKPTFPLLVTSTSTVLALGFENDHYTPQIPLVVPPYAGEDQPSPLEIPLWIQYKEDQWEEGPWVMPPYALIFPQDPIPQPCERGYDAVHHEWLKTHPRSTGPARAGSRNHRPQSVLAPYVPAQPIMKRSSLCTPYLPTLARTSNNKS